MKCTRRRRLDRFLGILMLGAALLSAAQPRDALAEEVAPDGAPATASQGCAPGTGQPLCDGVDTDCDGIVDQCDSRVELPQLGRSIFARGDVFLADGVEIGNDRVYVRGPGPTIGVFDPSGVYLGEIGLGDLESALDQALDAAGNLYVSDSDTIKKFDAAGTLVLEWIPIDGSGGIGLIWGIAVDALGNVYACDRINDRIMKFDSNGNFLTAWGVTGDQPGQLDFPVGVAVAPDGTVYVADTLNDRIQQFDATGNLLNVFGDTGFGPGLFLAPIAVAVDASGDVWVVDIGGRAHHYDAAGNFIAQTAFERALWGVEVAPDGTVFVATSYDVAKLDPGLNVIGRFGQPFGDPGELQFPVDAAVDDQGNVYVIDEDGPRVNKFSPEGEFMTRWTIPEPEGSTVEYVAVDPAGNVYVTDERKDRVMKFSATGQFLLQWGSSGSGPGQFIRANGIAVDSAGNVLVADLINDRIQKFDGNGTYLDEWSVLAGAQNRSVFAIAVDPGGRVYAADAGLDEVLVFSGDGVLLDQFAPTQLSRPRGIVVDGRGNLYTAGLRTIQQFTTNGTFIAEYDVENSLSAGLGIDSNGIVYAASRFAVTRVGCRQLDDWYFDADGDTYGIDADVLTQCEQPDGYVPDGGDCDDGDALVSPGENEPCNGVDNDCNGAVDDDFIGDGVTCGDGACGDSLYQCFDGMLECVDADTTPPELTVPDPLVIECNTLGGVALEDPAIQAWLGSAAAIDECGEVTLSFESPQLFPVGATTVTFIAIDDSGNQATADSTIAVADTTAPDLTVALTPALLWPPNHRMVDVHADVIASDVCGQSTLTLVSLTSDEPDDGEADGDTVNDIQDAEIGGADFDFGLRAERAGTGDGRTYAATYVADDGFGNATTVGAEVFVPHDQGGITEPVEVQVGAGGVTQWTEAPGAESYNVIRGKLANLTDTGAFFSLGPVVCLEAGSTAAGTTADAGLPGPGDAFFYLVEYVDGLGRRNSYGTVSASKPRRPGAGDCQ